MTQQFLELASYDPIDGIDVQNGDVFRSGLLREVMAYVFGFEIVFATQNDGSGIEWIKFNWIRKIYKTE